MVSGKNSSVEGVATNLICGTGIRVLGSKNEVEGNTVGLSDVSIDVGNAGIIVAGSGGHRIRHNEVGGLTFGIFVSATNNLIEENNVTGNLNTFGAGDGIAFASGATGNTVRHNQALGNLPTDILDTNALPANTYDHNLCQFSNISVCNTPLPNIAGHSNFEPGN